MRKYEMRTEKDYRDFLVGKIVMLGDELGCNDEVRDFLRPAGNMAINKLEDKIEELQSRETSIVEDILDIKRLADEIRE